MGKLHVAVSRRHGISQGHFHIFYGDLFPCCIGILIQSCIDKKKIVEAIILDTIAFNDTQKVTKKVVKGVDFEGNPTKYTQTTSEFWSFRCVQILSNLPVDYAAYFKKHYNVVEPELEVAIAAIRAANNQKLYRYLAKTLKNARDLVQFA